MIRLLTKAWVSSLPSKVCNHPGCGKVIVNRAKCDKHTTVKPEQARHTDRRLGRASAADRGYDYKWHKARTTYIKRNPLCVHCLAEGKTVAGSDVDHIIRHKGQADPLFWDRNNWQTLCKPCHSRKTRQEQYLYEHR